MVPDPIFGIFSWMGFARCTCFAALLAGRGAGVWQDAGELRGVIQEDARFEPLMSEERRSELCVGWRAAVRRACT